MRAAASFHAVKPGSRRVAAVHDQRRDVLASRARAIARLPFDRGADRDPAGSCISRWWYMPVRGVVLPRAERVGAGSSGLAALCRSRRVGKQLRLGDCGGGGGDVQRATAAAFAAAASARLSVAVPALIALVNVARSVSGRYLEDGAEGAPGGDRFSEQDRSGRRGALRGDGKPSAVLRSQAGLGGCYSRGDDGPATSFWMRFVLPIGLTSRCRPRRTRVPRTGE